MTGHGREGARPALRRQDSTFLQAALDAVSQSHPSFQEELGEQLGSQGAPQALEGRLPGLGAVGNKRRQ